MSGNIVYVPKPELTVFQDTFLECEVIGSESFNRSKLRVRSVLIDYGKPLPDLTARNEDSIITVSNRKLYNSIEELKLAS